MKQKNFSQKLENSYQELKEVSKKKGVFYVVRAGIRTIFNWLINSFWYYYYKILKSSSTFTFKGHTYNYFYHKYNTTWRNERAVEVPIIWDIVKEHYEKEVLEVGNVLSHYFQINHDVLDKSEKAYGVINQDVVDYQPSKKYDLIISISTLEHVGYDDESREPIKILRAIENLKNCLVPRGKVVVTLPLGYNSEMDKLLLEGKIQFTKHHCLKRISADNKWIEVDWKDMNASYNDPFPFANGLVIGILVKEKAIS